MLLLPARRDAGVGLDAVDPARGLPVVAGMEPERQSIGMEAAERKRDAVAEIRRYSAPEPRPAVTGVAAEIGAGPAGDKARRRLEDAPGWSGLTPGFRMPAGADADHRDVSQPLRGEFDAAGYIPCVDARRRALVEN